MTLNGEQLPRSQMVKCLGVWIDDGLTQKRQAEAVRKNCFHGCAKLRKLQDADGKRKLYCALVLPYLDYCSQECTKLARMA